MIKLVFEICLSAFLGASMFLSGYVLGLRNAKDFSSVITDSSKEDMNEIAYHEAGHAIVARLSKVPIPVKRIVIGRKAKKIIDKKTGGLVEIVEPSSENKASMRAIISICLAGCVAEKVVYNEHFSDCAEDLKSARECAEEMVLRCGMSELGIISFVGRENQIDYSMYGKDTENKARRIVMDELRYAEREATRIINNNRQLLDVIAQRLIFQKEMSGDELEDIINSFKQD